MATPQRIEPRPGQESVWDYPRPPSIESCSRIAGVYFAGIQLARSSRAFRVLETAGAPTIYIPAGDVETAYLELVPGHSTFCEWKGNATYFDVRVGDRVARRAAWTYLDPTPEFRQIKDHISFYPARMDACYLDDELVAPQPGGFYGGWVTGNIVGPIKGEPGSESW
jgi:uncharacterized protein (DUF427 family)